MIDNLSADTGLTPRLPWQQYCKIAMPYRLRVTQEEVRQELGKMGFKELSDDTVAAVHKGKL